MTSFTFISARIKRVRNSISMVGDRLPFLLTKINTDRFRSDVVIDHFTEIRENFFQSLTSDQIVPENEYRIERE